VELNKLKARGVDMRKLHTLLVNARLIARRQRFGLDRDQQTRDWIVKQRSARKRLSQLERFFDQATTPAIREALRSHPAETLELDANLPDRFDSDFPQRTSAALIELSQDPRLSVQIT